MILRLRSLIYLLFTISIVSCGGGANNDVESGNNTGGTTTGGAIPNEGTPDVGTINIITPNILSFSSSSTSITAKRRVNLVAVFQNGTGVIDNGVGNITSATPISVQPTTSKTYNLTVTNAAGVSVKSTVSVNVTPFATVNISWNANPETAVNRIGGGYRIYYSSNSGFDISDGNVTQVDVPYSFGAKAPTSTQLKLLPGTYYIRILAFSALNAPEAVNGSTSTETPQITIIVT